MIRAIQVSTDLMKRVSLAEQNFTQEMPFEWKVSPHFDLVLDTAPVLESLKSLELYEKKGTFDICFQFVELEKQILLECFMKTEHEAWPEGAC